MENSQSWLSDNLSLNKVASYKPFNFVDGEGVRCSLYVSGCKFNCEGCYNVVAQNFNYGVPYTKELENQIIEDLSQSYCQGLTLLGGEPFLNTAICLSLVRKLRETFQQTKDIWVWSGYTFEELLNGSADKVSLLQEIDILVDGKFELSKRDLTLQFRGSYNQRVIDVKKSFQAQKVVIWDKLIK